MKRFLIIGNLNAISYKEIFPLIKENKLWLGIPFAAGNTYFSVDDVKEYATGVYDETTGLVKFRNCHWYTNLDHSKRHQPLELTQTYDPAKYPRYDNYDAIEVSRTKDIPKDYDGVMGVPITFLDKWCPEQFKILDARDYALNVKQKEKNTQLIKDNDGTVNGTTKYCRALNQRSNEMNARPVIDGKETYRRVLNQNSAQQTPGETFTYVNGKKKYARVFNEHSHPNPLAGGGDKLMEG